MLICEKVNADCIEELSTDFELLSDQILYSVHQRSVWYKTCYQTLCNKIAPYILVVREKTTGKTLGILPLQINMYRGTRYWYHRRLVPLSYGPSDFFNFLVAPGKESEVCSVWAEWFWQHRQQWERAIFDPIPETSCAWIPFVQALEHYGFLVSVENTRRFYRIDTTQNWDLYYQEFLHKKLADLRNRRNRLARYGYAVEVETITTNIEQYLPALFQTYHQRRVEKNQEYATSSLEMKQFLSEVIKAYENDQSVRLSLLRESRGEIMAYQLDWVFKGVRYHYKPTFVDKFRQFSPSKILLFETIKESFLDPTIVEFNFMRGESDYKTQFANESEAFVNIKVENPWSIRAKCTRIASKLTRLRDSVSRMTG